MLRVENLTVVCGGASIVDHVSFSVEEGRWLMIVGPNGAGKSTIINAVTQGAAYSGRVLFEGTDVSQFKPSQLAKKIGTLTQNHMVGYAYTVEDVIRLGRYAYTQGLFSAAADDETCIDQALELTGLKEIRGQSILTLSGGELQRTFLAQVIAQDPKLLLLDELANHLDLLYQKQMFELVQTWLEAPGRAVVSVVHDLSLAKRFGTDAVLLKKGQTLSFGPVEQVLSVERLNPAYDMNVREWMLNLLSLWK
ncbi:MAG: ABC transporter ATP-binding protein [Clostridiales bacterium]|jgi:iron complex transport system ATP-binding protein|nr:ABC transporter ATP-binding protein [Clostridiales bacterium]